MNPFATVMIKLLEAMFAIGVLGSLAVIAVTMVEDVEVVLGIEESAHAPGK